MGKILMLDKQGNTVEVAKADVNARKKEGYKITSKYAQKRLPKDKSKDKK